MADTTERGTDADAATGIALDGIGNVYVAGNTASSDFPATVPRIGVQGRQNVFCAKLDPDGNLLYSIVLGGDLTDTVSAIAVSEDGNAHVVGTTQSRSFPTTPGAFQTQHGGVITNGFASMLLVLHQDYEPSYAFQPVGEEVTDGRTLIKIHFKPVAGAASPAAIQLRSRNYPLPLAGDIWIDSETGSVVKLISSLESPMDDVGLHELRSEIHYFVVQFHDPEEAYWMPASAIIDVETPKQHWRNVHRFTSYRRFRATIQVQFGDDKP